jgi:hypothetical protein
VQTSFTGSGYTKWLLGNHMLDPETVPVPEGTSGARGAFAAFG